MVHLVQVYTHTHLFHECHALHHVFAGGTARLSLVGPPDGSFASASHMAASLCLGNGSRYSRRRSGSQPHSLNGRQQLEPVQGSHSIH